jgi:hypothetical protein
MADNSESEELFVEDLNLGDISGSGLSGIFARPEGADKKPPGLDAEPDEDTVPTMFAEDAEPDDEDDLTGEPTEGKLRKKRGGLFGGLGKLKETFNEELEKAKAEEESKGSSKTPKAAKAPAAATPPLKVPDLSEEQGPAPLQVPDVDEEPAPIHAPRAETPPAPLEVPSLDEDEELIYEEPTEPEPEPEPVVAPAAHAPAEDPSAPPLLFDEGDEEEESGGGFLSMLRQRWAMAKADQRDEVKSKKTGPEGAGVDVSPPGDSSIGSIFRRITGGISGPIPAAATRDASYESGFAALLKPLAGTEVAMLQAELAGDETVFARIDRQRRDMADRQLLGFLIGLACLVFFAISSGRHYLVDVLPHAAQPTWIPDAVRGDPAGAGLFAVGLLVPLISLFVIADAVRYLISAAALRRIDDLLLGMVASVCSLGALYSCSEGQVVSGAAFLIAYGIVQLAARLLGVKKG